MKNFFRCACFLLMSSLLFVSCDDEQKPVERKPIKAALPSDSDSLISTRYQVDSNHVCEVNYHAFTYTAAPSMVNDSINAYVRSLFVVNPENYNLKQALQLAADSFYADFTSTIITMPEMEYLGYSHYISSRPVYTCPSYICIRTDRYLFSGGAHGMGNTSYANFDMTTGKCIQSEQLLKDSVPLLEVAEMYFRMQKGLMPNQKLDAAGYWFPKGRFYINDNIGLLGDTLVICFNPYEIAPYSEGFTELNIPVNVIQAALNPNFLPKK